MIVFEQFENHNVLPYPEWRHTIGPDKAAAVSFASQAKPVLSVGAVCFDLLSNFAAKRQVVLDRQEAAALRAVQRRFAPPKRLIVDKQPASHRVVGQVKALRCIDWKTEHHYASTVDRQIINIPFTLGKNLMLSQTAGLKLQWTVGHWLHNY